MSWFCAAGRAPGPRELGRRLFASVNVVIYLFNRRWVCYRSLEHMPALARTAHAARTDRTPDRFACMQESGQRYRYRHRHRRRPCRHRHRDRRCRRLRHHRQCRCQRALQPASPPPSPRQPQPHPCLPGRSGDCLRASSRPLGRDPSFIGRSGSTLLCSQTAMQQRPTMAGQQGRHTRRSGRRWRPGRRTSRSRSRSSSTPHPLSPDQPPQPPPPPSPPPLPPAARACEVHGRVWLLLASDAQCLQPYYLYVRIAIHCNLVL